MWSTRRRQPADVQATSELPRRNRPGSFRFRGRRHADHDADHKAPAPTTTTTKAPAPTTTTTKAPAPTTTTTEAPEPTTTTTKAPTTTPTDPDPPAVPDQYVSDVFARTTSNGLGTADIGGPYTVSQTATGFFVANGVGRIPGAVGSSRSAYLPEVHERDIDYFTDLSLDTAPSGGGAYVSMIGRHVSAGNDYRLWCGTRRAGRSWRTCCARSTATEKVLAWKTVPGIRPTRATSSESASSSRAARTTTLKAAVWSRDSAGPATLAGVDDRRHAQGAPGSRQTSGSTLYTSRSWVGRAPAVTIDNFVVRER